MTLLYFKSPEEIKAFCKERNWKIEGNVISFKEEVVSMNDIPVDDVIHNVLHYAKELEMIV